MPYLELEEDREGLLHNPNMGWVLYENDPVDPRSTTMKVDPAFFDAVDYVAVMFTWADVERERGVYDFSKVDAAYTYWESLGKRLMLRISTESLLWWEPVSGIGVPHYVREQLSESEKQQRTCAWEPGQPPYWVFDARNRFYQERLRCFLREVAIHFSSSRRPVELIDMRGFGLWGEWHTGFQYESLEARIEALRLIIDCWVESFPDQYLVLSYSFDPDSPPETYMDPANYRQYLEYSAFDYALTKRGIGWRRDGCGEVVRPVERMLCEEAFRLLNSGPFMSEPAQPITLETAEHVLEDELSLHPNYITALPVRVAAERPDLFRKGLVRMGYRFVLDSVRYPDAALAGGRMELKCVWRNVAVGKALRDYELRVVLRCPSTGEQTNIIQEATDCHAWVAGDRYTRSYLAVISPHLAPGRYDVLLSMFDLQTQQSVSLAIEGANPDKTVHIGELEVR